MPVRCGPYIGERRVVRRFAWLPVRIDENTVIWWERYKSHEEYCAGYGQDGVNHWLQHSVEPINKE